MKASEFVWSYADSLPFFLQKPIWVEELSSFFAVGGSNGIFKSSDGEEWVNVGAPAKNWRSITYSPALGRLCAGNISHSTSQVFGVSDDGGSTWSLHNGYAFGYGRDVAWSEVLGQFVGFNVFSSGGTPTTYTLTAHFSATGLTWSGVQVYTTEDLDELKMSAPGWGEAPELGKICVISGNSLFTAEDMWSWTRSPSNLPTSAVPLWRFAWGGVTKGMLAATDCQYSLTGARSTDLLTWHPTTVGSTESCTSPPIYVQDLSEFVAVANWSDTTQWGASSGDGQEWSDLGIPASEWTGIAYSPELKRFVAFGYGGEVLVGDWEGSALAPPSTPFWTNHKNTREFRR